MKNLFELGEHLSLLHGGHAESASKGGGHVRAKAVANVGTQMSQEISINVESKNEMCEGAENLGCDDTIVCDDAKANESIAPNVDVSEACQYVIPKLEQSLSYNVSQEKSGSGSGSFLEEFIRFVNSQVLDDELHMSCVDEFAYVENVSAELDDQIINLLTPEAEAKEDGDILDANNNRSDMSHTPLSVRSESNAGKPIPLKSMQMDVGNVAQSANSEAEPQ